MPGRVTWIDLVRANGAQDGVGAILQCSRARRRKRATGKQRESSFAFAAHALSDNRGVVFLKEPLRPLSRR